MDARIYDALRHHKNKWPSEQTIGLDQIHYSGIIITRLEFERAKKTKPNTKETIEILKAMYRKLPF